LVYSSNDDDQIRTDDQSFGSDSEFPPDDPFAKNQKKKTKKMKKKSEKKTKEKKAKKKKSKDKALPPIKGTLPPLTGNLPPLPTTDSVDPLIGISGSAGLAKSSPTSRTTTTSSSKSNGKFVSLVNSSPDAQVANDVDEDDGSPSGETVHDSSEIIDLMPDDSLSNPSIENIRNGNGSVGAFSTRNIQQNIMPVPIINVIPAIAAVQDEDQFDMPENGELANLTPVNRLPENINPSLLNVQNSQVFLAPVRSQQACANMLIQNSERRLAPTSAHSIARLRQAVSNNRLLLEPTHSQPMNPLEDLPSLDDLNVQPQLIAAQSVAGMNEALLENEDEDEEVDGGGLFANINRALEREVDSLSV